MITPASSLYREPADRAPDFLSNLRRKRSELAATLRSNRACLRRSKSRRDRQLWKGIIAATRKANPLPRVTRVALLREAAYLEEQGRRGASCADEAAARWHALDEASVVRAAASLLP